MTPSFKYLMLIFPLTFVALPPFSPQSSSPCRHPCPCRLFRGLTEKRNNNITFPAVIHPPPPGLLIVFLFICLVQKVLFIVTHFSHNVNMCTDTNSMLVFWA